MKINYDSNLHQIIWSSGELATKLILERGRKQDEKNVALPVVDRKLQDDSLVLENGGTSFKRNTRTRKKNSK